MADDRRAPFTITHDEFDRIAYGAGDPVSRLFSEVEAHFYGVSFPGQRLALDDERIHDPDSECLRLKFGRSGIACSHCGAGDAQACQIRAQTHGGDGS